MTTHAFTLGVNTYKDPLIPPLGCCERDARELNGLLKERFGFDAHYLEERFTESIEERIESLGKHLKPGDVFIFYFSGHGKAHQDDHYLLLPGARLAAFESGAVAVSGVLSYRNLKHITSGGNWRGVHRLFIIDACRSHLTSKKSVGEPVSFDGEYLLKDPRRSARRLEPGDENLTLLNSCALGACAVELPGEGHGIFTAALLDLMRGRKAKDVQDGLAIDPGFVATLGETMTAKASRVGLPPEVQHQPALVGEGLRLVSDFPDAAPVDDGDEVDWVLAKAKDTLEALESYVRSHPRGAHVNAAVARITELSQQARDVVAREANAQRVAAERAAEEKRRHEAKCLAEELERKVNAERIAAEEKLKAKEQEVDASVEHLVSGNAETLQTKFLDESVGEGAETQIVNPEIPLVVDAVQSKIQVIREFVTNRLNSRNIWMFTGAIIALVAVILLVSSRDEQGGWQVVSTKGLRSIDESSDEKTKTTEPHWQEVILFSPTSGFRVKLVPPGQPKNMVGERIGSN